MVDSGAPWTAFFGYSANYLVDADNAIIVDVEATTAIRQAETLAAKHMIERSLEPSTARPAAFGGRPAAPSTRLRSLASAWIKLAYDGKTFATDQTLGNAALQYALEQTPQQIALTSISTSIPSG
jgi:hypothetical protein